MTTQTLWHTIRLADGSWPYPFEDVQAQTDQHDPDIGAIGTIACATNQGNDLHICATKLVGII